MPGTPLRAAFSAVAAHRLGIDVDGGHQRRALHGGGHGQHAAAAPDVGHRGLGLDQTLELARHMRVVGWAPLPNARPGSIDSTTSSAPTHAGASCHAGTTTNRPPARHGRANSRQRSRSSSPSTGSTTTSRRPTRAVVTRSTSSDGHARPQLDQLAAGAAALLDPGHAGVPQEPRHQVGVVGRDPCHHGGPATQRGGHSVP